MGPLNLLWAQLILSSDIIRTMNETANPCDDFYKFACGNYPNKVKLPEEEAAWDAFAEVAKRINKELRSMGFLLFVWEMEERPCFRSARSPCRQERYKIGEVGKNLL